MYKSAAREGAKALAGCDCWDVEEVPAARAVGEISENNDPSSKVNGYTRRTTGEGAGRQGVAIVVFRAMLANASSQDLDEVRVTSVRSQIDCKDSLPNHSQYQMGNREDEAMCQKGRNDIKLPSCWFSAWGINIISVQLPIVIQGRTVEKVRHYILIMATSLLTEIK